MKRSLIIFLFVRSFLVLGQQTDRSPQRNAFGYFVSTGAITRWGFYDELSVNQQFSESPSNVNYTAPSYGLFYNCRLNYLLTIHGAVYSSKEHFKFDAVTNQRGNLYIDYKISYLRIPLGLRLYLTHAGDDIRPLGGGYVQITANFDYISQEDIYTRQSEFVDPNTPGYVAPPSVVTETHSSKFRFNRVSPAISLGQEIVGKRISVFYGGEYEFTSVYQEKNTQEFFKNWKFTILQVGLSYRF